MPPSLQDIQIDLLLETGGGGSGRHVLDLYRGLRQHNLQANLLLSSRRIDPVFAEELNGVPGEHVRYFAIRRSPHPSDIHISLALRNYLGTGNHLLHAHSTKAGILGWAARNAPLKKIFTPHAYRGMDPTLSTARRIFIQNAERLFSSCFDRVIAVSPEELSYAESSLGLRPERLHFCPNGVDVERIRSYNSGRKSDTRKKACLGFIGRLVPQKNPLLFLQTLLAIRQRGHDVEAIVFGDGNLLAPMQEYAAAHDLSNTVRWMGEQPVVPHLNEIDILVHTSTYESFPYTLLEAAAAGVPMISVKNAGSQAILEEHLPTAIVADNSSNALAEAIIHFLENDQERAKQERALAQIATQFSMEKMVMDTIQIYKNVLEVDV